MKAAMGVERKYYDTSLAATNLNTGAAAWTGNELDPTGVLCLSAPAQGDGATNRDGNKITVTSVEIWGHVDVSVGATGTAVPPNVFLALIQDTQCNGTELNSEDVFTSGTAENAVEPLRNMSFGKRFKVLKEWKLSPTEFDAVVVNGSFWTQNFKHYRKLTMPVTFTTASTAAGVASVASSNALFLIGCIQDNSGTSKYHVSYNARIRFIG